MWFNKVPNMWHASKINIKHVIEYYTNCYGNIRSLYKNGISRKTYLWLNELMGKFCNAHKNSATETCDDTCSMMSVIDNWYVWKLNNNKKTLVTKLWRNYGTST